MIATLRRIRKRAISINILDWVRLISITGAAQIILQLIAFLSGILIIRMLTTQEFAIYTMANSILGVMAILSDGGISAGVMAQGSKVWNSKEELGKVVVTGLKLRRKFGIVCLIVTLPIAFYLLRHHGASWINVILIVCSIIPAFFAALSDSLLEIAPRLHQDILPLQKNAIAANLGRLALIIPATFLFPSAFIVIICAGIPRLWANLQLKKISSPYVDWTQESDEVIEKNIFTTVKRVLPEQIYFCLSSQITIWLISVFGSTNAVAQLGALSRLSFVLSIFIGVFQTIAVPRFARLPNERKLVARWFIAIQIFLLSFLIILTFAASFLSESFLWILGSNYSGLEGVFVLSVFATVLSSISGVLYGMLVAKNWILPPTLAITTGVITQVVLILSIDLSNIKGAYYYTIIQTLVGIMISYVYVYLQMRRWQH